MKTTSHIDIMNDRQRQMERIKTMQDVKKTFAKKIYCAIHLTARPERNEDGTLPGYCASGERLGEVCAIVEADNE